ncbi:hypothetical protein ABEF95_003838 [Exophiala dermatitidis]
MSNRDPYTFQNQSTIPEPMITAIHGILKSWDIASTDHTYLNHFHSDGILHVITAEPTKGAAAIKKLHDTMLNPRTGPVVKLQHFCDKVFLMPGRVDSSPPASASASASASVPEDIQQGADHHRQTDKSHKTEAIFTGKLTSTLITGEEITTDFATWIVLSPATSLDDTNAEKTGGEGGSKRDADAEPELSLRVEYLRVFSDTCALTAAIAAMGNGK